MKLTQNHQDLLQEFAATRDKSLIPGLVDLAVRRHCFTGPAQLLTEQTSLAEDLKLDSLGLIELCLDLEDQLGAALTNDELRAIHTIGGIRQAIASKL